MTVSVEPHQFTLVTFDAGVIATTVAGLLDRLGMSDVDVHIEVDETSPVPRARLDAGDPLVVRADSGAFEDTKRPRQLSPDAVVTAVGRLVLRWQDRAQGFAAAPADDDLSLAEAAAWDAWSVARLGRAGYPVNQQRWRYNFRNRHGFTDEADVAFDTIWVADELTWEELAALSGRALTARALTGGRGR